MLDWPGSDGKIRSRSNLKLSAFKRPCDIDRGYLC